jgi:probable rRNA maturation factor
VFLDDDSIKNLNKNYRWINKSTDVLSFHYFEDFSTLNKADIAGELVFSEAKIISQWKEYGLWIEKEFYKLLIHSVLHILAYDHEREEDYKEMQELEDMIWMEVF